MLLLPSLLLLLLLIGLSAEGSGSLFFSAFLEVLELPFLGTLWSLLDFSSFLTFMSFLSFWAFLSFWSFLSFLSFSSLTVADPFSSSVSFFSSFSSFLSFFSLFLIAGQRSSAHACRSFSFLPFSFLSSAGQWTAATWKQCLSRVCSTKETTVSYFRGGSQRSTTASF